MTKAEVQEQAKALGLSGELRHLDSLKANPDNPRVMRDEKFVKLCNSIRDFPKMMALRPMVFDENGTVLGGNMRLRALQELGYRFIPVEWAKAADALTDDEKRRFIIEDNVGFGDWDWDALANEWTDEPLGDWGLESMADIREDINALFDDGAESPSPNTAAVLKIEIPVSLADSVDDIRKAIAVTLEEFKGCKIK